MKRALSWLTQDKVFFTLFFIIALTWHLASALRGWNHSLLDHHEFRQTQTAITAYYFIHDGFHLNYITPVLGKPWTIPLEFPAYQMLAAALALLTRFPLDQTGRFVSLGFFYLSLIPIYQLLSYLIQEKSKKLFILSFILMSPVYIFWSRTFMIESCALFFSLAYAAAALRAIQTQKLSALLITALLGSLAALVKVTTLAPYLIIPGIYYLYRLLKKIRGENFLRSLTQEVFLISMIFVIPLLSILCWIHYGDSLKIHGSLGSYLSSASLSKWNFGTWEQKLSFKTWGNFYGWTLNLLGLNSKNPLHLLSELMALALILRFLSRWKIAAGLLLFSVGPLVFSNLYEVHDYYWYANGIFLLIVLALAALYGIEQSPRTKLPGKLFVILMLTLMAQGYQNTYGFMQTQNNDYLNPLTEILQENVPPQKAILIFGDDWNSRIPYYAQRKALMLPGYLNVKDQKFQKTLADFEKNEVGAVVIVKNGDFHKADPATLQSLQDYGNQSVGGFKKAIWQTTPKIAVRFIDLSGDLFEEIRNLVGRFELSEIPVYEDLNYLIYAKRPV